MCIEDVRLGRRARSRLRTIAVGTSSVELCTENKKRVSIIISSPVTVRITISTAATAIVNEGINLYPAGSPLILDVKHFGDLTTQRITAIGAALAAETIGVIESTLDDE